jgi:hypothetical protein
MVAALLAEARRSASDRVVLGTGVRQEAALALYRRLGFREMPCWGTTPRVRAQRLPHPPRSSSLLTVNRSLRRVRTEP